jgi:hypothetical protein
MIKVIPDLLIPARPLTLTLAPRLVSETDAACGSTFGALGLVSEGACILSACIRRF